MYKFDTNFDILANKKFMEAGYTDEALTRTVIDT